MLSRLQFLSLPTAFNSSQDRIFYLFIETLTRSEYLNQVFIEINH